MNDSICNGNFTLEPLNYLTCNETTNCDSNYIDCYNAESMSMLPDTGRNICTSEYSPYVCDTNCTCASLSSFNPYPISTNGWSGLCIPDPCPTTTTSTSTTTTSTSATTATTTTTATTSSSTLTTSLASNLTTTNAQVISYVCNCYCSAAKTINPIFNMYYLSSITALSAIHRLLN